MKKNKEIVKLGDIIQVPLNEEYNGYIQLVRGEPFFGYYIAYNIKLSKVINLEEITSKEIIFLMVTNSGLVDNGRWKVIGNISVPKNLIFPEYKVEIFKNGVSKFIVENSLGEILREATENDIKKLNYLDSYTPNILESALKAKFGYELWEDYYNEFLYNR